MVYDLCLPVFSVQLFSVLVNFCKEHTAISMEKIYVSKMTILSWEVVIVEVFRPLLQLLFPLIAPSALSISLLLTLVSGVTFLLKDVSVVS